MATNKKAAPRRSSTTKPSAKRTTVRKPAAASHASSIYWMTLVFTGLCIAFFGMAIWRYA